MRRLFAALVALTLTFSPALSKCMDPADFIKKAQQKAPDAERASIVYPKQLQGFLKRITSRGFVKPPSEPFGNYVEGWVIQSISRQQVTVLLISKKSDPLTCEAINVPYRHKDIIYYPKE